MLIHLWLCILEVFLYRGVSVCLPHCDYSVTNSPENFNTITPTITENFNSKFTVSNKVGHPVFE